MSASEEKGQLNRKHAESTTPAAQIVFVGLLPGPQGGEFARVTPLGGIPLFYIKATRGR